MSDFDRLTSRQQKALLALLGARSIREAALAANISEATLFRMLADSTFKRAYMAVRREAVMQGIARIQAICTDAVGTLGDVASDAAAPTSGRLRAAEIIIQTALKSLEIEDLADRLEKLEGVVEDDTRRRSN